MCKVQAAAARADMSAFCDVIREQDMADYPRNEKKKRYLDSIVKSILQTSRVHIIFQWVM